MGLRYKSSPPVVLHEDDRYIVSFTSGWTGALSQAEVTVREGIHLEVSGKAPARQSDLRRVLSACGDLLSIFCQRICAMDELVLLPPAVESQPRRLGTHHAVPIYSDRDKSYSPADTLVPATALAGRVPDMFSRFIAHAETPHDVRALYLSGGYGGGFIENRLIALTQAAEAFHRRFHFGEYMSGDVFAAAVRPHLEAALPTRRSLRLRIGTSNWRRASSPNEHRTDGRLGCCDYFPTCSCLNRPAIRLVKKRPLNLAAIRLLTILNAMTCTHTMWQQIG